MAQVILARLSHLGLFAAGVLCLLYGMSQATAQTMVSEAIAADAHWTLANSPYVINGEVTVQGGAMLTIDAGVTVYMTANAGLTVQAGGIRAAGTAANPIRVLSDKSRQGQAAVAGDWNQWVFNAGTVNTQLDHVLFQHGKGLAVNGAAPVFNYLNLRNHKGAAIAIDLSASPTGIANQASGNGLNGVAVPAGDIAGSVKWGLRGIPYIVTSGIVSVGASPTLQSVTPNTVEQGQTVTLTLSGSRLEGVGKLAFDKAGLALTPFSGGSASQIFVQVKVDPKAAIGSANLEMQVDAGLLTLANAISVTQPMSVISTVAPTTIIAGGGETEITLTGRNFSNVSEVLFNGAAVPTRFVNSTELRATLPSQTVIGTLQAQVRWPDAQQVGKFLLSNQVGLAVQAPVPPTVSVEPTPIALPPDSKARNITVRLSKADYRANTLRFSISDASKASVTASVLIPAGQTTAQVTITPLATGTVSLSVSSDTLQGISVPVFITADFRGANTAYAAAVGVNVLSNAVPVTRQITLVNANVGVAVGAVLSNVSPAAWVVGSKPLVTIRGAGIPANAQLALVPNTGVTLGAVTVSDDGSQLSATFDTAADAPLGPRKLVIKDAAGKELTFADPAKTTVQLMSGLPQIVSIDPLFGARDSTVKLVVQGRNLQQGQVRVLNDAGIRIDSMPQVNADGTTLTAYLQIAADAPTGSRVIQIATPAGSSTATAAIANTFTVVSSVSGTLSPIAAPLVGVMVGAAPGPNTNPYLVNAKSVGVVLGSGITEVVPNTGVIGTDVSVTVRGAGLQGVTTASLLPATGVTILGTPNVNPLGTDLSFTVRIDADAALGTRKLVLATANGPVTFVNASGANFLISARVPELISVTPQVLQIGQPAVKLTARGRNFSNVAAVRLDPAQGVTVTGPLDTNPDATVLSFSVAVAAGAPAGDRVVVVTSAAGDSSSSPQPGNTVHVASQSGVTYADLPSQVVGVQNGAVIVPPPQRIDGTLASSTVGVLVGSASPPQSAVRSASSMPVGVLLGSGALTLSPNGWLQGANGNITLNGRGLNNVTAVSVTPATGLLLGTQAISDDGTQLSVSLSVAPDAPRVLRRLILATASGAELPFADPATGRFGIGMLPSVSSMSPIVLSQGKGSSLTVRGANLKDVNGLVFLPASGVHVGSDLIWSQDALGELLTVSIYADPDAALGSRAIRFDVPGGSTSTTPTPSNTINVVAQ
ncbi:IPT/TIG domain-containing protein [Collimonas arenae]|uniref:IPT/TIG domain-containing protein n=1 Tax=Collimonas arenae TaxID=279058 RepID=UPI00155AAF1E|nr:IPT/TIG domain-containing protein [Collimonas arenae]